MINNILVPIDLSSNSKAIVEFAEKIALKEQAKVTILHAYHLQAIPDLMDAYDLSKSLEDVAYYKKLAEQKIEQILEDIDEKLNVEIKLIQGLATDLILSESKLDVDLIVMGNRQRENMMNRFFGSISSQIARKSSCPVICVPGENHTPNGSWILAWDLSRFSDLTPILPLLQIIKSHDIVLNIVHYSKYPKSLILQNALAAANVEKMTAIFESHDIQYSFQVIDGESIERALEELAAEKQSSALIVIPKQHDWLSKLFGKSHSRALVEHFPIPVISIPTLA